MKQKWYLFSLTVGVLAAAALLSEGHAQAQQPAANASNTGSISGRVTGTGMEGATVVVTNVSTGASQSIVADSSAAFTIRNLPPGSYRVAVHPKSGITLGEKTVDLTIPTGQQVVTSTVDNSGAPKELEGRSPTLQTETAAVTRD